MSAFTESKLNNDLVEKAVAALLKYETKKAGEGSKGKALLMSNYAKPVLVQVQLFKDVARAVTKPTRVKIPHSLFNTEEEDNTICLFCRSDDKESISQYLEKHPIKGLTKVVSINDAKKHYVQFKDKKALLNEHTHFICDSRIAGQLYNILGSTFSARSDYPVQINFTNPAQLPGLVQKVIDSTYFHLAGRNISIRLGHTGMKSSAVLANILEGLPFAVEKLQNGWADVHSIHLKTSDSAALPIYSQGNNEMMTYVAAQAAQIPAAAEKAAGKEQKTPGKGKKATTSDIPKPSTPAAQDSAAPVSAAKEIAQSGKKRKAETAAVEAPAPVSVSAAPVPAPTSALKKAKAAVEVVPEVSVPAAPKSAAKGKKTATEMEVVEEAAPTPAPVPKSAVKAPATKKTPAKAAAAAPAPEPVVAVHAEVEPTPRKSARRGAAKEEGEPDSVAATTPGARTAPKRAASARK